MSKPTKASRSLQILDLEIRGLRRKARQLENKIDENFNYFQEHSGSMFVRSLLPRKIEGESLTGIRLVNSINEELGSELLLEDLFDFPTVAELDGHLREQV